MARWWNHETTPEALERDFGPSVDGLDATSMFIGSVDGRRLGLIQRYPIEAYPEYLDELNSVCAVPAGALSVDYFVAEDRVRRRGFGAAMISALVSASWGSCPEANDVIVPVSTVNIGSWRALERAGFTRIAEGELEPDNPRDARDHVVYAIRRP